MSDRELQRECDVFCRYLVGTAPSAYVIAKYQHFHNTGRFSPDGFDRFLIRVAVRGPLFARFADTYASRFAKLAVLRRKLVFVLALLESTPPSSEYVDTAAGRGVLVRMAVATAVYLTMLVVGTVLLAPTHWVLSRRRNAA
jgi:hypothetical protein